MKTVGLTRFRSGNKDWCEEHDEREARLKAGEISPERREAARFMHRMVDLWEAGKLKEFQWSARLERLQEQGPEYYAWGGHRHNDPWAARYRSYAEGDRHFRSGPVFDWIPKDPRPTRTETSWRHGDDNFNHEYENALAEVRGQVDSARGRWRRARKESEQKRRLAQLIQDWVGPRGRRPTRKVAAARYGASESSCRKLVAEWQKNNPCGPKGERRRRGM